MATKSIFDRQRGNNYSRLDEFKQSQEMPGAYGILQDPSSAASRTAASPAFGGGGLWNRAATPSGRSNYDPVRQLEKAFRGTAKPGQLQASLLRSQILGQQQEAGDPIDDIEQQAMDPSGVYSPPQTTMLKRPVGRQTLGADRGLGIAPKFPPFGELIGTTYGGQNTSFSNVFGPMIRR